MAIDLITCIRSFIAIVDYNGFANAARHIHVSTPVISKQIKSLEESVGKKLFYRTTRRVQLTEAGEIYLHHAKKILSEVKEAQLAVLKLEKGPQGSITIGAPSLLNSMFFTKMLKKFLDHYPKVSCRLTVDNVPSTIIDETADIVISANYLEDPQLIRKTLFTSYMGIYATPAYLKKYGTPKTTADLAKHNCLINIRHSPAHEWEFANHKKIKVQGNFISDSGIDVYFAGIHHLGLFYMTNMAVVEELRAGRLIALEFELMPAKLPIYIYYRPCEQGSIIRLLIDHVIEATKSCIKS